MSGMKVQKLVLSSYNIGSQPSGGSRMSKLKSPKSPVESGNRTYAYATRNDNLKIPSKAASPTGSFNLTPQAFISAKNMNESATKVGDGTNRISFESLT